MSSADPSEPRATRVRDAMTSEVATLRPDDRLSVAEDVMRLGRIRHLPVVDERGELCGIVSQRDLLRSAILKGQPDAQGVPRTAETLRVDEVMTRVVVTIGPDASLREAAATMFQQKLGCLAVVEHGKLIGILTEADFVRLAL